MELILWILAALVFYAYLGYGLLLFIIILVRRLLSTKKTNINTDIEYLPEVTLFVAAYNENDFIHKKVENSLLQDYPQNKITHLWVTDGSNDGTPDILRTYEQLTVLHEDERKGKIGAINRGMKFVKTPIVIFSDGNTMLSINAVSEIVKQFRDAKTGCVAGEKNIELSSTNDAATAGEGIYWKYESLIKKWDAEFNTSVGAVGELFAIRSELFEEVEADTLLDDFVISLRIAMRGYKIQYAPKAVATEKASANVKEELKRKIRISAGGVQSLFRLAPLLNPFKYKTLTFQYISHKVIRWFVPPIAFPLILLFNFLIIQNQTTYLPNNIYIILFYFQIVFYATAVAGLYFEKKKLRIKPFFIPYYICMMNYAVILGIAKHIRGKQSVLWERAKRST